MAATECANQRGVSWSAQRTSRRRSRAKRGDKHDQTEIELLFFSFGFRFPLENPKTESGGNGDWEGGGQGGVERGHEKGGSIERESGAGGGLRYT